VNFELRSCTYITGIQYQVSTHASISIFSNVAASATTLKFILRHF